MKWMSCTNSIWGRIEKSFPLSIFPPMRVLRWKNMDNYLRVLILPHVLMPDEERPDWILQDSENMEEYLETYINIVNYNVPYLEEMMRKHAGQLMNAYDEMGSPFNSSFGYQIGLEIGRHENPAAIALSHRIWGRTENDHAYMWVGITTATNDRTVLDRMAEEFGLEGVELGQCRYRAREGEAHETLAWIRNGKTLSKIISYTYALF